MSMVKDSLWLLADTRYINELLYAVFIMSIVFVSQSIPTVHGNSVHYGASSDMTSIHTP